MSGARDTDGGRAVAADVDGRAADDDATSPRERAVAATAVGGLPGLGVLVVASVFVGFLVDAPGLLFVAALGVLYGAASRATDPPVAAVVTGEDAEGAAIAPDDGSDDPGGGQDGGDATLLAAREIDDTEPVPGQEVTVTVTVYNGGRRFVPSLTVTDTLPDGAVLVGGSPRHATALRPGEAASFEYTVRLDRGEHEWGRLAATATNHLDALERSFPLGRPTALRCLPEERAEYLPVRALGSLFAGRIESDRGGPGLEFFATRAYQIGDPRRRIDWRHLAKTGELATLLFREEHQATVMLVVDARAEAHLSPGPETQSAIEYGLRAARPIFAGLLDADNPVGISVLARRDLWLPPSIGREHRARGRELLATHELFSGERDDVGLFESFSPERGEELKAERIRRLDDRLPGRGEVILFSPCCDGYICRVARELVGHGHAVTVVSPDPTLRDTAGHTFAATRRSYRLRELRRGGVRVLDWDLDEPLAVAIDRAEQRWSR